MKAPARRRNSGRGKYAGRSGAPPTDERSPPQLDEAVLRAARRAVRFQWLHDLLESLRPTKQSRWQILVAFALGMLAGVGLETLVEQSNETPRRDLIHAGDPSSMTPAEEGALRDSPASWLRWIAGLVLSGEVEAARDELQEFRERYPDHGG